MAGEEQEKGSPDRKVTSHHSQTFDPDSRAYLLPTRWWFASTASPLIAGTFGPMANAFSICALSRPWRSEIEPVGPGTSNAATLKDPHWLRLLISLYKSPGVRILAINALSLAFALISNISLLLNMARRLSFQVAQPITVGGFYIASILLISLAAAVPRRESFENLQLTQGYYYAILAAAVYFFISSLLLLTVYGAKAEHYSQEFNLTTSQRTVMLQTIIYMFYLLIGALVYSTLEDWKFLDAVYWADFTILTMGIGDLAPVTPVGRGLLFPFAVFGVLTLALIIRSISLMMLERGKSKLTARTTEKIRRTVAQRIREGRGVRFVTALLRLEPHSPDATESVKQRHEFYLMRNIHQAAAWQLRWVSLLGSLSAWAGLWLLGALAFYISESEQSWSYFDSLYFCFTSLLTIGYGDVSPGQTWGKPFFVLWSLLAIPTTTILFSSMGDTIASIFDRSVLLAGELTVLPGDMKIRDRLRQVARFLPKAPGKGSSADELNDIDAEVGHVSESLNAHRRDISSVPSSHLRMLNTSMLSPFERQFLLIREIRKLQSQLNLEPPKQFSYDEWRFYLRLLGTLDSCSSITQISTDGAEEADILTVGLRTLPSGRSIARKWSWIGMRSPLMGDKDEAEWIFEALSHALEQELGLQSERSRHIEKGEASDSKKAEI